MFIIKAKNNNDWNYYEAKDFQFIKLGDHTLDGNDIVITADNGYKERYNVDDFVPQDLGPPNSTVKLLLLRQKNDTILTVAFSQDAYLVNELGKTIDKL